MLGNRAGSRSLTLALLALAATLPAPQPVQACERPEPVVFQPDPNLRELDSHAPSPFTKINARVDRHPAVVCKGGECTSTSCGSFGTIELDFVLPSDDQNELPNLGYRVMWLSGARPSSAGAFLDHSWPLSEVSQRGAGAGQLSLQLSYGDVADLDAEIALVAIDRAGNESEPSEPIHLEWSGCTRDGDECLEDIGCGVSRVGGHRLAIGWVVAAALGLTAIRRRLSVRHRHGPRSAQGVQS